MALWPAALLFPAAVPFGLGQVLERLEIAIAEWLQDTPFLEWLPMREVELQRLPADLQLRLKQEMQVFLAEKPIIGCGGLTVTDEMRVTIAAQACPMSICSACCSFAAAGQST